MNTVLIFLANVLTAAAFPAMSVSALELFAILAALTIGALALNEYARPQRPLPALQSRVRRKSAPPSAPRALSAV